MTISRFEQYLLRNLQIDKAGDVFTQGPLV